MKHRNRRVLRLSPGDVDYVALVILANLAVLGWLIYKAVTATKLPN